MRRLTLSVIQLLLLQTTSSTTRALANSTSTSFDVSTLLGATGATAWAALAALFVFDRVRSTPQVKESDARWAEALSKERQRAELAEDLVRHLLKVADRATVLAEKSKEGSK